MPNESLDARRQRTRDIVRRLKQKYPQSEISLESENEIQLLVSVILSAQCTDARVNLVTRDLFQKYRTVDDFANADPKIFEQEIRSTGFYRNKTKNVIACAQAIRDRHGGQVPDTMDELVELPGVARKTANVVLHNAFGKQEGIAVDTHVTRISRLLRLTRSRDPVHIERDLVKVVDPGDWGHFTHLVIDHGRAVCIANRPRCEVCPINELCPGRLREPREPLKTRLKPVP